jgi:FkbM family methyltransferase
MSGMEWLRAHLWYQVLRRLPPLYLKLRTRHGVLKVSSRDQVIGRLLFVNREFEYDKIQKTMALLKNLGRAPSTRTVLDIGGNIGTVALPLVREGWFSSAVVVEPEPRIFDLLSDNILLNGLGGRIQALNIALSDHEGTMRLQLSADNFGDNRIVVGEAEPGWQTVDVAVRRLDNVLKDRRIAPATVGLIWMDVQGHEYHVLRGAESLLSGDVPLLMEFWPLGLMKAKVDKVDYVAFLRRFFGRFHDLAEEGSPSRPLAEISRLFETYPGESFTDLLFVK